MESRPDLLSGRVEDHILTELQGKKGTSVIVRNGVPRFENEVQLVCATKSLPGYDIRTEKRAHREKGLHHPFRTELLIKFTNAETRARCSEVLGELFSGSSLIESIFITESENEEQCGYLVCFEGGGLASANGQNAAAILEKLRYRISDLLFGETLPYEELKQLVS